LVQPPDEGPAALFTKAVRPSWRTTNCQNLLRRRAPPRLRGLRIDTLGHCRRSVQGPGSLQCSSRRRSGKYSFAKRFFFGSRGSSVILGVALPEIAWKHLRNVLRQHRPAGQPCGILGWQRDQGKMPASLVRNCRLQIAASRSTFARPSSPAKPSIHNPPDADRVPRHPAPPSQVRLQTTRVFQFMDAPSSQSPITTPAASGLPRSLVIYRSGVVGARFPSSRNSCNCCGADLIRLELAHESTEFARRESLAGRAHRPKNSRSRSDSAEKDRGANTIVRPFLAQAGAAAR